jgi:hypothetical protein
MIENKLLAAVQFMEVHLSTAGDQRWLACVQTPEQSFHATLATKSRFY